MSTYCTYLNTPAHMNMYFRPLYFQLIEECVSQIVLQKNGIDPDPRTRFTLNVDHLISSMSNAEEVSRQLFVRLYLVTP